MQLIKKIIRILVLLVLSGAVVAYIVYALYVRNESKGDVVCNGLVFDIKDDLNARFMDESGLREMIATANIDPSGKKLDGIDLTEIEDIIRQNQYVDSVECFKTPADKVCVSVIMRTPVVYVMPDSAERGYFVDSHGTVISNTRYSTDIVVATGSISLQYATTTLTEFGNFLRHDDFWNNQIEQIHITRNEAGQCMAECVPRVGDQIIYLGQMTDFELKFQHLKLFYLHAMPEIGWNRYSRLNLEYENQLVGVRRKHHLKEESKTDTTEDIHGINN